MLRSLIPLVFATSLTGCIIDDGPDRIPVARDNGLLTVAWTVDGTDDPAACAFEGADTIDIFVEHARGGTAAHVSDFCEVFVTSIELRPGSYFADAVLLDVSGRPITTTVDLGFFEIFGRDELIVDVDFPLDSFF